MNDRDLDWDALQALWIQAADSAGVVATAHRQMARARTGALIGQGIEAVVAAVAIAFIALALHHAANAVHATLGIMVGGGIGAIWIWRRRLAQREQRSFEATGADHLVLMRGTCKRQLRMALFVEAVIVLDLLFLIPWWITGSRVHSRRLTDVGSLETMWVPIIGMVILFGWAMRVRSRARRELAVTASTEAE
ncbi:MAG: hypothetical protein ACHQWU_02790 [Gemmatimonadales bacterium]